MEEKEWEYIRRIEGMGGSVQAIESGFMQNEIARSSYEYQQSVQNKERIIVGVNSFETEEPPFDKHFTVDDSVMQHQREKLDKLRSERDAEGVRRAIAAVEDAAKSGTNLMPHIITAVEGKATLGEIADALRRVFGEYA